MVRLGSGSGDMKRLTPDAIDRGVVALERFARIAAVHDADIHAVATSAVREAENAQEFLDRARDEAGVEVDVISGVEEARLIHLGVLQAVPVFDQRLVLIDIGGGSTEILVGEKGETLAAGSLKLGAIRLSRRFFRGDRLHPGAVDALPPPRALGARAHGPRGRAVRLRGRRRLVGHRRDHRRDGPGPARRGAAAHLQQLRAHRRRDPPGRRRPGRRPTRVGRASPAARASTPTGPTSSSAAPSCSSRRSPSSASTS